MGNGPLTQTSHSLQNKEYYLKVNKHFVNILSLQFGKAQTTDSPLEMFFYPLSIIVNYARPTLLNTPLHHLSHTNGKLCQHLHTLLE